MHEIDILAKYIFCENYKSQYVRKENTFEI